jgi:uncharacterized protein YcfJ
MKIKNLLLTLPIIICSTAFAQNGISYSTSSSFTDYGKIHSVKPDYSTSIAPTELCRQETIREEIPNRNSVASGVINRQNGNYEDNEPQYRERTTERCVTSEKRIREHNGYIVTYEYKGKIFKTRSRTAPTTNKIYLTVEVKPQ